MREPAPEALDTSHDLAERRFCALSSGFTPRPPVGATLKDALEHLMGQALAHEFPAHPEFEREVRSADLRKVRDIGPQAAGTEDGRVLVEDRSLRPVVRQIANPLRLGTMSETHFVLATNGVTILTGNWRRQTKRLRQWGSCADGLTSHSRAVCQRTWNICSSWHLPNRRIALSAAMIIRIRPPWRPCPTH